MALRLARPVALRSAWRWLVWCGVLGLMAGCAATSITSQVQSFGRWPEGRKPGTFAFDVLPSQQVQAKAHGAAQATTPGTLQAAALPSLQALGFTALPPDQADRAEVLVQLGLDVRAEPRMRYEPFVPYPYFSPYPYPHGPVSPRWRAGMAWGGPAWVASMDSPWVTVRVSVILRDRHTGQVLYETHASHDRIGAADEAVLPWLFDAALRDFPNPPPGPRVIDIPLPLPRPPGGSEGR